MNITMQLTFEGLVRALRWRALAIREDASLGLLPDRQDKTNPSTENGGRHEQWRRRLAEGAVCAPFNG